MRGFRSAGLLIHSSGLLVQYCFTLFHGGTANRFFCSFYLKTIRAQVNTPLSIAMNCRTFLCCTIDRQMIVTKQKKKKNNTNNKYKTNKNKKNPEYVDREYGALITALPRSVGAISTMQRVILMVLRLYLSLYTAWARQRVRSWVWVLRGQISTSY